MNRSIRNKLRRGNRTAEWHSVMSCKKSQCDSYLISTGMIHCIDFFTLSVTKYIYIKFVNIYLISAYIIILLYIIIYLIIFIIFQETKFNVKHSIYPSL